MLRKKFIGDAAFYRRLLYIAIPIMMQSAISNFVSLLDNIMVGRVGTEQMTGVAIANQLFFIYFLAYSVLIFKRFFCLLVFYTLNCAYHSPLTYITDIFM